MRTIIEPFRIKMTEKIPLSSRKEREEWLKRSKYNLFLLKAREVTIDLLTDSGTGAMSAEQWAALMLGDESYAGSQSWERFEAVVQEITGMPYILPTHQGRAAERILAASLVKPGQVILSNGHFDTTRANLEYVGGVAIDIPIPEARQPASDHPFKGNMDLGKLEEIIQRERKEKIPFCMLTITNNTGGGQPVSLENAKAVKQILAKHGIPLIIDCCRFAENAYFIEQREPGQKGRPLIDIAKEMMALGDGATMSAKKDGLAHIGGFLATRKAEWLEPFRNLLILTEGFPTYGGLAGRDLEAIAVGLKEALDPAYQEYRHATVRYLATACEKLGIPTVKPAGGHAVFIDAGVMLPHLKPTDLPGVGLINALYLEGGIRAVEIGTLMFGKEGKAAPLDLVRLAFPRRVYTQSHFDYAIEVLKEVVENKKKIPAHRIVKEPPFLRHFTAELMPA